MYLIENVKLYTTKEQERLIVEAMREYVETVNRLVSGAISGEKIETYTTKHVNANLTSCMKNQCLRDARSVIRKYEYDKKKRPFARVPVLKKPCCHVNSWNYKIVDGGIRFSVRKDGKNFRQTVRAKMTERQRLLFETNDLGSMRIALKNGKLIAQIAYAAEEQRMRQSGSTMGVDLGMKCPAVSYASDGRVRFYGNGRKNKYLRRHYAAIRSRQQKSGVDRISDKEQRVMNDTDHKISRQIVDEAEARGVKVIKMERLSNIRSTTRKSRKNNRSLFSWTFGRLESYVTYKAALVGIAVELVNPAYTSQTCPQCGVNNRIKDRRYECKCGFISHRDVVGAVNICNSTGCAGGRKIRCTA